MDHIYLERLSVIDKCYEHKCWHPYTTESKYERHDSRLALMMKCSLCRKELNHIIERTLVLFDQEKYKTKGRNVRTFKQRLLFRPCDEDVEVKPTPVSYWLWSINKSGGSYDCRLLYSETGKCFDLVTYNGKKMFRRLAQIHWENISKESNRINTEHYRRLDKINNISSQVYPARYHPNGFQSDEPRMSGNARDSDPAPHKKSSFEI
jgi:hypothetical protein